MAAHQSLIIILTVWCNKKYHLIVLLYLRIRNINLEQCDSSLRDIKKILIYLKGEHYLSQISLSLSLSLRLSTTPFLLPWRLKDDGHMASSWVSLFHGH